jgi:hypothetical protein
MLKFVVATVVGSALALSATDAIAGGRRCHSYYAPAPVAAPAPGAVPMAQAPQGYRAYSFQPTQPSYRAYGSRVTGGNAYESAVNKSLGRGF